MARILIAEDEAALREFISRALTHIGHETVAVEDGAEALAVLQRDKQFDLLLTDIVMPVMDGIALALKVTKDFPDLKVLMMTGYAAERQRAYNLEMLIHDVIAKPFSLDEICEKVEEALTSDRSLMKPVTTADEGLRSKE
ncbi:response regulator [Sneathiella sp. CAU 1612]|uniref:Response regulator n=1 Tax=Sneathiella sedimenti TaxID=2816034 RepID=A0ABS3F314_9PROT|nr:response regulator [Sneathiella sedimenti]MBO0332914.1 response regulator [Sneathiella sedimenti]